MSRTWYAQTKSWASVSKTKRQARQRRRTAHGPYAPRGRSSLLHRAVEHAKHKADLLEAEMRGRSIFEHKMKFGPCAETDQLANALWRRVVLGEDE